MTPTKLVCAVCGNELVYERDGRGPRACTNTSCPTVSRGSTTTTRTPRGFAPHHILRELGLGWLPHPDESDMARLGEFRLLELVNKGGHGAVFRAQHVGESNERIIKVLLPARAAEPDAVRRFLREVRLHTHLIHRHIYPLFFYTHQPHVCPSEPGVHYGVMPVKEGCTLKDFMTRKGNNLTTRTVLRFARHIARGLQCAHENGVLHRDIKPSNIWIEFTDPRAEPGPAQLLDFGIATYLTTAPRPEDDDITRQESNELRPHSVGYTAPEVFGADEEAKHAPQVDLFSLGVVMYEMACGRSPFDFTPGDVWSYVSALSAPRPLCPVTRHLPGSLVELIARLLASDPKHRPASAKEVADELLKIQSAFDRPPPPPPPVVVPTSAEPASHKSDEGEEFADLENSAGTDERHRHSDPDAALESERISGRHRTVGPNRLTALFASVALVTVAIVAVSLALPRGRTEPKPDGTRVVSRVEPETVATKPDGTTLPLLVAKSKPVSPVLTTPVAPVPASPVIVPPEAPSATSAGGLHEVTPPANGDESALAARLLTAGATIRVRYDGGETELKPKDALPAGALTVVLVNKDAPDAALLQLLVACRKLEIVQLRNAPVTDDWVKALAVQPINVLHLVACPRITDKVVPHLLGMELTELDLAGSQLTSKGVGGLAQLRLKLLGLNGCRQINDEALRVLGADTPLRASLQRIWLEYTDVSESGLKHLESMDLTELNIKRTLVAKAAVETFQTKYKPDAVKWERR